MKILFLSRLYYPHVGGIELHLEKICDQLVKDGHQITILTTAHEQGLPKKETYKNVEIVRIPMGIEPNKRKLWQWIWSNKASFLDYDIIHAHDVFWWFWPLKLRYNLQIFTTFHGYEGVSSPSYSKKIHRKIVELCSSKTLCIGDFMRKWYWANPDFVSYGASDITTNKKIMYKKNSAIYLGRLAKDAGIMEYLKIVKVLKDQKIDLFLDVYGDGPAMKQSKKYSEKHCLNVSFKGFVKDAYRFLPKYEYAFVSRYLAIIEAMQSKKQIFAHYNNQIKEDYLVCHPQAKNMKIFNEAREVIPDIQSSSTSQSKISINEAYQWAKLQSWQKMTKIYTTMWGI